jgi:hypothetical protein
MSYHSARRLTGKTSKVITECGSEITKERNERARNAREEKRTEEREVLIKVVTELWSEDKRSVTKGYTRPIEYCLSRKRRILSYKNVRLKVADTAKKRADEARRVEELHQRQAAYERKQNRERVKRSAEREQRLADLKRIAGYRRTLVLDNRT